MNGFIPPPYPFVEAWPRVFRSAEHTQWLTPRTPLSFDSIGGCELGTVPPVHQPRGVDPTDLRDQYGIRAVAGSDEEDEDEDNDEYEYGFVLTDEWRERLIDRVRGGSAEGSSHCRGGSESGGDRRRSAARKTPPPAKRKQQPKQQPSQQRRQRQGGASVLPAPGFSRAEHLQQELEDAKMREAAMRWWLQRAGGYQPPSAAVRRLEASLSARFDDFCDAFQPVVWPHSSAR